MTNILVSSFKETDTLATDIGMDFLAATELTVWVEQEFGHVIEDIESLTLVSDILLAASWHLVSTSSDWDIIAPQTWKQPENETLRDCAEKSTLTDMFLAQAQKSPSLPVMVDPLSGVKTYRDILANIFALAPVFENIKDTNIGLMLPAGVTCTITYYILLFADKLP